MLRLFPALFFPVDPDHSVLQFNGDAEYALSRPRIRLVFLPLAYHFILLADPRLPSSVEVLGMFRSFGSIPLPHASFMISQMLIIPGKIVALFGPFFIEKFFEVCYNNSTL